MLLGGRDSCYVRQTRREWQLCFGCTAVSEVSDTADAMRWMIRRRVKQAICGREHYPRISMDAAKQRVAPNVHVGGDCFYFAITTLYLLIKSTAMQMILVAVQEVGK